MRSSSDDLWFGNTNKCDSGGFGMIYGGIDWIEWYYAGYVARIQNGRCNKISRWNRLKVE